MPELSHRMSAQDAAFLYYETANAPLHVASFGIFEGEIALQTLVDATAAKIHLLPRYRQRAILPPFNAGLPTWEDDPDFAVERHIRGVRLAPPGTRDQLERLIGELSEPPLSRDRPLWDVTVISGLEDGNTAFLTRVHHCMIDGVSGVELMLVLLDLVPEPPPVAPPPTAWEPKPLPEPVASWADATFAQFERGVRDFTDWQRGLLDPRAMMRQSLRMTRALQTAAPLALRPAPRMRWNRPVTPRRRCVFTSVPFQEVRGIRGALGGTVNDVMLTVIGGALGRYLRAHGEHADGVSVRVMIPTNVRSEDEQGALGNRVSMMLPDIPTGIKDPAERLKAVTAEMARVKARDESGAFESFLELANSVPAAMAAAAGSLGVPGGAFNLVVTNVPGPLIPLYGVGHRMIDGWSLLPLAADLGLGVAIASYDKRLYISIVSDPTIVEDVEVIRRAVDQEYLALREAAGVSATDLPEIGFREMRPSDEDAAPFAVPVTASVR